MNAILASYLAAYGAVLVTVLAMLLLVMIAELSNASWFDAFRPYAEAVVATLPALAVGFLPILLGAHVLYPWTRALDALPDHLRDQVVTRRPYLSAWFAIVRALVYWIAWIRIGTLVRRASRERSLAPASTRLRRLSAAGIPIVALTLTFATFDWIISLTPDWTSSIYAVYFFSGGMIAALSLLAFCAGVGEWRYQTALPRRSIRLLARLLLAFVLFWAYCGFSQALIVWIADLPREVTWYVARMTGGNRVIAIILIAGHFALPFLALITSLVRRSGRALVVVSALLLLMHHLDVFWQVNPGATAGVILTYLLSLLLLAGIAAALSGYVSWQRQRNDGVARPLMEVA